MTSRIHPCHDILRDVCRDLMKDYDRELEDLEKFIFSGRESFLTFLEISQSVESAKLYSNFLDITFNDGTFFSVKLSTCFNYLFYILGRYIRSLHIFDFCRTQHHFFQGLIDNQGLVQIRCEEPFNDPAWLTTLKSVRRISASQGFYRVLATYGVDFSFESIAITSRMQYNDFSDFLELKNLRSEKLAIELYPVDYEDSLFHPIQSWSSLKTINLTINLNAEKPVGLLEMINKLSSIFPNLENCRLENVVEDEALDPDFVKKSISETQGQFSTYVGRANVDVKWTFVGEVHLNWDDDLLEKFCSEIKDHFPDYKKDEDTGTHTWTEKVFLTPNLSFESVIIVNETEYNEDELHQILEDAGIHDEEDYDYYDQMEDVDGYDDYDYYGDI
ncbi:hypothetical protein FO519_005131 [Halicephalobus sp. NKZ332]|nr:hypothetical protein FO519_005131 [Halicephalobus sp. NKZ332]